METKQFFFNLFFNVFIQLLHIMCEYAILTQRTCCVNIQNVIQHHINPWLIRYGLIVSDFTFNET